PAWLFALGTQRRKNGTGATVKTIAGSSRNVALTSAAGSMRRRGMSEEAGGAALLAENATFPTPLGGGEVEGIVKSAAKNFAPDPEIVMGNEAPPDSGQFYAEQLAVKHGDRLRFNHEMGRWFVCDNGLWSESTENLVIPFVVEMGKELYR